MTNTTFRNANEAYEYLHNKILLEGVPFGDTKALFNVGFYITDPMDNKIINRERNWKLDYAEAEWEWYLSGDRNIKRLGDLYGKVPEIWKRMADDNGKVNSNYGYQWERNSQLNKIYTMLKGNPSTRQACVSIYDGKEHDKFATDTPCTYAIQFTNVNNYLNMCVTMRSNDLWYGFCNDQYCFSKLQELVCKETGLKMGTYFHFAHNLHIYSDKLEL